MMKDMKDTHYAYPPQDKDEFEELCQRVRLLKPETIMEIGSRHGRSLIRLAEASMPSLKRAIVLDLPNALWGREGSEKALRKCCEALRERGIAVQLHLLDSHSNEARALAEQLRGQVDFLFIDGDHTYNGVSQDYIWFGSCVREGGAVAFHDVCAPPHLKCRGHAVGVPALWNEIKAQRSKAETFHSEGSQLGIGWLPIGRSL